MRYIALRALITAGLFTVNAGAALAHGAERGFVMLLPTGHFILGGALAVAASCLIVFAMPGNGFLRTYSMHVRLGSIPERIAVITSVCSAVLLAALIHAGFHGSRDPLANPLPLTIWTLWWVIVVILHMGFGHLWAFLNPFTGPYTVLNRFTGGWLSRHPLPRPPKYIAYAPAFFLFLLFAWFQLVTPAPDDPQKLAVVVLAYAIFTFGAVCMFGPAVWLGENDPFAVFFRLIAAASPLQIKNSEDPNSRFQLSLAVPGAGLADQPALPPWGAMFVLLTLSSVSFDGFSNTFFWLAMGNINPLDFPGRTALIAFNTLGLVESFAALSVLFIGTVLLGWTMAQRPGPLWTILGSLVFSLIPISMAFHIAHYLTDILVNGQYVLLAMNDPLFIGWDLLGFADYHVTTSFLNTAGGAKAIYFVQTSTIVAGHIAGVAVAHLLLLKMGFSGPKLFAIEGPLAALMIAYTAFGLWTLSTPSIG